MHWKIVTFLGYCTFVCSKYCSVFYSVNISNSNWTNYNKCLPKVNWILSFWRRTHWKYITVKLHIKALTMALDGLCMMGHNTCSDVHASFKYEASCNCYYWGTTNWKCLSTNTPTTSHEALGLMSSWYIHHSLWSRFTCV